MGNAGIQAECCYHADASARAALKGCDGVKVTTDSRGRIIFEPRGADAPRLHSGLIYYPGGQVEYTAYAPLMLKLARRGITCVLLKVRHNLAMLDVDAADGIIGEYSAGTAAAQETDLPGGVGQTVERWYIGGHSIGGMAACMYAVSHAGEYAGVLLNGACSASELSGTVLSMLTLLGENDGLMTQARYNASASRLPADAACIVIPGGCHAYFGSYGRQQGDGEPAVTADEQQEIAADLTAAWMSRNIR